ncbi:MAG: phosphatidate cytidylyltransferase [Lachnospiraceae bacterium]|nr:phosphatidate cytidylyltransferase [Lachnospiraceae bacterium]
MFWTRLISGIVLVLIALLTIITGGPVLLLTLYLVSIAGMYEFYGATLVVRRNKAQKKAEGKEYKAEAATSVKEPDGALNLLSMAGFVGATIYYLTLYFNRSHYMLLGLVVTFLFAMFVYVFSYPHYKAEQVTATVFGMVYLAVMLGFIYLTRSMESGKILVWLIFLSSWGADTCAYCVGRLFGKHKMAPVLSPKKSVEGGIGGVVGAVLLGVAYAAAFGQPLGAYGIICGAGALISMTGDLAASAVKRDKGIKDYGWIIPGHGGILDRFDSVIFTAPVIYFLALFVMELY